MKESDVFLKTVVEGMKAMAQGIEALAEKLDGIAKAKLDEKAKAKPTRKAPATPKKKVAQKAAPKKPITAAETVLKIINRSKKGVSPATISEKTGFAPKKVHNIVYKLKKEGKIKSVGRGLYLKV
jgi:predicted Rossmann fold nucleotide-binding protein DprA/Smf involved in DNA uptake